MDTGAFLATRLVTVPFVFYAIRNFLLWHVRIPNKILYTTMASDATTLITAMLNLLSGEHTASTSFILTYFLTQLTAMCFERGHQDGKDLVVITLIFSAIWHSRDDYVQDNVLGAFASFGVLRAGWSLTEIALTTPGHFLTAKIRYWFARAIWLSEVSTMLWRTLEHIDEKGSIEPSVLTSWACLLLVYMGTLRNMDANHLGKLDRSHPEHMAPIGLIAWVPTERMETEVALLLEGRNQLCIEDIEETKQE